jgi:MOSC domain-containing protein YiiM
MLAHPWVEVVAGVGILGDRYATGQGHWSDPRWPHQELTLIEEEVAEEVAIAAVHVRRNIVTRGVRLNALVGVTFQIGSVRLVGVRLCDPCRYLETLTRPGLLRALQDRGGLRTSIVHGGRIHVGDRVTTLPAPDVPSLSSTAAGDSDVLG